MSNHTGPVRCEECGVEVESDEIHHISLNPSIDTRTVKRGGCSVPRTTTTETYLESDDSLHLCDDHLHLAGEILTRNLVEKNDA